MKTLKQLLKDFLRMKDSNAGEASEPITINQKSKEHETETDSIVGDPELAVADAEENSAESEGDESGDAGETGDAGNAGELGEVETAEAAYERGRRDGRNEQIREVYFPTTDDGVPRFNGKAPKLSSAPTIFSMAREA